MAMNSGCLETMQSVSSCVHARVHVCEFFSSINFEVLKSNRKSIKNNIDINVIMASRQKTCGSLKMSTILLRHLI